MYCYGEIRYKIMGRGDWCHRFDRNRTQCIFVGYKYPHTLVIRERACFFYTQLGRDMEQQLGKINYACRKSIAMIALL